MTTIEQLRALLAELSAQRDAGHTTAGDAAHHVALAVAALVAAEPLAEDIAHGAPYAERP